MTSKITKKALKLKKVGISYLIKRGGGYNSKELKLHNNHYSKEEKYINGLINIFLRNFKFFFY